MHLVEILAARSTPAAGITLGLTRRCPLHCAHCSTSSTLTSEQFEATTFSRFVGTFTETDHPEFLAMSGGEVMLRPRLVSELAAQARAVGTLTMALSGMFFATDARVPAPIWDAIHALDHFSVSMDVFHEREVPRQAVIDVLRELISDGVDVSVHMCGLNPDDPYLAELTTEIVAAFDAQVPMFVNSVSSFGRARDWFVPESHSSVAPDPNPCGSAAWPLVAFDGTVVACGNDDVVIGVRPEHLVLGHIADDDWATIRQRCQSRSMVRALRILGPEYVADRFGDDTVAPQGYCGTCRQLSESATLLHRVEEEFARPSMTVLEQGTHALQVQAGAVGFARRHGVSKYADLVTCGAST